MTDRSPTSFGDGSSGAPNDDAGATNRADERRGPDRPQGDSRLPAHIMAAVRDTIRAAAATCVGPSRLEASGPYEWLAIVEANDGELYQLLRRYIEACRYVDELQRHGAGLGRSRLAEATRNATFAQESMRVSLSEAIAGRVRGGVAD